MDIADQAQRMEEREREDVLNSFVHRRHGVQLIVDGAVLCVSCRHPLSAARLDAMPTATRCVDCKLLEETREVLEYELD